MLSRFFQLLSGWWLLIALLLGFALLQILTIGFVLPVPFESLVADTLLYSTLYTLIAILLWNTLKYANFNTLSKIQQFIIYAALVLLSVAIIIGAGVGIYMYIPFEGSGLLLSFIPVRILISLLVIILLLQHFSLKVCEIENIEIPVEEQTEIFENEKTVVEIIERIAVKSGTKIHVVMVSDIVYIQSDGDYVQIFTSTGKYLKEQTMKSLEESLPTSLFARVHRTCIVNIQAIARVELYDKQSQQLTLKNGHQLKVSQAGYKMLRAKLGI
jgi:hypothetical protein